MFDLVIRHCNETLTLGKHVTKYKNIRKLIVEFFRKIENRGIKIARLNTILITKSIDLQLFTFILYGVGVRCDVDTFKLTASAQSIYREVYASTYFKLQIFLYTAKHRIMMFNFRPVINKKLQTMNSGAFLPMHSSMY